jgi:hypothetical protein
MTTNKWYGAVRYTDHNVRGVIGTGSPGHGAGRRAWMIDARSKRNNVRKEGEEVASKILRPLNRPVPRHSLLPPQYPRTRS